MFWIFKYNCVGHTGIDQSSFEIQEIQGMSQEQKHQGHPSTNALSLHFFSARKEHFPGHWKYWHVALHQETLDPASFSLGAE